MLLKYSQYSTQVLEQESLRKILESCIRYLRLSVIFLCGISYYFTVLFLSRDRPTISVADLYVSSLNQTSTSLTNTTTISIDLKFQNENLGVGIYYEDPLNLTITYIPQNITNFITIQGFYQGNGKVNHIQVSTVVQRHFLKR
ncbi:unnamed protein product [Lactuca virosa]|uniref:Late embryogenesis abundant protein LEA-2 subgroup domain-containing protein n=1 Tax=Lactuca virosa TaxID=75947 RepID=A0AAU9PSE7_9ASTR|nr:unnamed protein product [Lactuca virosa]